MSDKPELSVNEAQHRAQAEKLVKLLASGYPDPHIVVQSWDAITGTAKLMPEDSLGYFIVSEAVAVSQDFSDRPCAPVAFEVALALRRAARELESLALHCRKAGMRQVVLAFLGWARDHELVSFGLKTFHSWLDLHVMAETRRMGDLDSVLWSFFPDEGYACVVPWTVSREDLLKALADAKV